SRRSPKALVMESAVKWLMARTRSATGTARRTPSRVVFHTSKPYPMAIKGIRANRLSHRATGEKLTWPQKIRSGRSRNPYLRSCDVYAAVRRDRAHHPVQSNLIGLSCAGRTGNDLSFFERTVI